MKKIAGLLITLFLAVLLLPFGAANTKAEISPLAEQTQHGYTTYHCSVTTIEEVKKVLVENFQRVQFGVKFRFGVPAALASYYGNREGALAAELWTAILSGVKTNFYVRTELENGGGVYVITENSKAGAYITVSFPMAVSAAELAYVRTEAKKIIASIINGEMKDSQKIDAINAYIVDKITYAYLPNSKAPDNKYSSAYLALTEGKAVCEGYSLLGAALLDAAGIEARILKSPQMNHAWNLVKLDHYWHHVDFTWNDPTITFDSSIADAPKEIVAALLDEVRKKYLLKSDAEFSADHAWDNTRYPSTSVMVAAVPETTVTPIAAAPKETPQPTPQPTATITPIPTPAVGGENSTVTPLPPRTTPTLLSEQIVVVNNVDKLDAVLFNGLMPNDKVAVYSYDGTLLGTATARGERLVLTLKEQLSETNRVIMTTVQNETATVSSAARKSYDASPISTKLTKTNVSIINRSVTVKGLGAGDRILIYDKQSGNRKLLWYAVAQNNQVKIGMPEKYKNKTVFITRKSPGKLESVPMSITVK